MCDGRRSAGEGPLQPPEVDGWKEKAGLPMRFKLKPPLEPWRAEERENETSLRAFDVELSALSHSLMEEVPVVAGSMQGRG